MATSHRDTSGLIAVGVVVLCVSAVFAALADEPEGAGEEPQQAKVVAAPSALDLAPEGTCGVIWIDIARLAEEALGEAPPSDAAQGYWGLALFILRPAYRLPDADDPPLAAVIYAEPGTDGQANPGFVGYLRAAGEMAEAGELQVVRFPPFPVGVAVSPEGMICFGIPESTLGVLPCLNPEAERPGLSPLLRRLLEKHGDDMIRGAFAVPAGAGTEGQDADGPPVCASLGANVAGILVGDMRLEIELLVECDDEEEARAVAAELTKIRDRATVAADADQPAAAGDAGVAALLAAAKPWLAETEFTFEGTDAAVRVSIDVGDGEVLLSFLQAFVTHYGFPIDDESEGAAAEADATDAD
jgi:hypothetical protein